MDVNESVYIEIPALATVQNERKLLWNLYVMIGVPAAILAIILTIFFIVVK
jgi:hypothetical protein